MMRKTLARSRAGLNWYADRDWWFILPLLAFVVFVMFWRHG